MSIAVWWKIINALGAARNTRVYNSSHGLKIVKPRSSKCLTLRVTTVRSCSRAVAAIGPSGTFSVMPFNLHFAHFADADYAEVDQFVVGIFQPSRHARFRLWAGQL